MCGCFDGFRRANPPGLPLAVDESSGSGVSLWRRLVPRVDPPPNPFDALPNELLEVFFANYVLQPPAYFDEPLELPAVTTVFGSPHTPLLLSHVCSRWRSIALSNPALWATFSVSHPQSPQALPLLGLYLERSAGAMLQVELQHELYTVDGRHRNYSSSTYLDMLLAIASHSKRIQHFVIGPPTSNIYSPGQWARMSLSSLKTLQLGLGPREYRHFMEGPLPNSLTDVEVYHSSLDPSRISYLPLLSQLKLGHLSDIIFAHELLGVLKKTCDTLEELHVACRIGEGRTGLAPDEIILMPRLAKITFARLPKDALARLRAPALKGLELNAFQTFSVIGDPRGNPKWLPDISPIWPVMHDFLVRSGCQLEDLTIHGVWSNDVQSWMTADHLKKQEFGWLRNLTFTDTPLSIAELTVLTAKEMSDSLVLPRLKTISTCIFPATQAILQAFIDSRKALKPDFEFIPLPCNAVFLDASFIPSGVLEFDFV